MKNKMNAYKYFTGFNYKRYFSTHLRYIINPAAHIRERLFKNDIEQTGDMSKQTALDVIPRYLIDILERNVQSTQKNMLSVENNLYFNNSLNVLHIDVIKRLI